MPDWKPLPIQVLQWQSQPEQKALAGDRRNAFTTKHTFDEASNIILTGEMEDIVMEDACSAPTSARYIVCKDSCYIYELPTK